MHAFSEIGECRSLGLNPFRQFVAFIDATRFLFKRIDLLFEFDVIRVIGQHVGGDTGILSAQRFQPFPCIQEPVTACSDDRSLGLQLRQFTFQIRFLLAQASDIAISIEQLSLRLSQQLHVELYQLRQRPVGLVLHGGEHDLEFLNMLIQILRFPLQKGGGFLGVPLTALQVFRQKETRQFIGDLLCRRRSFAVIGQGKRDGRLGRVLRPLIDHLDVQNIDLNVLGKAFQHFLRWAPFPKLLIETILFDYAPERGTTEDLLLDRLDALIRIGRNRRPNQIGRNLLLFNKNRGSRTIDGREEKRQRGTGGHECGADCQNHGPAPAQKNQIVRQGPCARGCPSLQSPILTHRDTDHFSPP